MSKSAKNIFEHTPLLGIWLGGTAGAIGQSLFGSKLPIGVGAAAGASIGCLAEALLKNMAATKKNNSIKKTNKATVASSSEKPN